MKKLKHDEDEDRLNEAVESAADYEQKHHSDKKHHSSTKPDRDIESRSDEDSEKKKDEQFNDLAEKYIRLAAEYDNYRKRTQKEKESIYADAVVNVVTSWLPVIDSLERGMSVAAESDNEEVKKVVDGIALIAQQLKDVLDTLGVSEVETLGQTFDPNTMEAIMHVEDESAGVSEVLQVFSKGYIKGGKVIRHAIVKVAN